MMAVYSRNLKLPADAMHPLFALSLTRKLRNLYDGNYFEYLSASGLRKYPESDIDLDGSKLVRIYDQKVRFGLPSFDAVQNDDSLRPTIRVIDGEPVAIFEIGQYLDLQGNPAQFINSPDFTITVIGDGDVPRPMLGIWGQNRITVEPGNPVNRFTFNQNNGSIGKNASNRVNQLFSGIDPSQNGKRVLSMKSDGGGSGQLVNENIGTNFSFISIGREDQRYFSGKFIEVTFHFGDLTSLGADKVWSEAKIKY